MDLMFILFWFFPDRAMDGHRWCDVLSGSQAKPYRESESRDFCALRQKQAVRNRDFQRRRVESRRINSPVDHARDSKRMLLWRQNPGHSCEQAQMQQ
jgi:hypothetical protein